MNADIYKNDLDGWKERIGCIVLLLMTAVLIGCTLAVMMKGCGGGEPQIADGSVKYKYIYVRDTVRKSMYIDRPVPVSEVVPVLDTIVIRDTVETLRDHFTERRYEYSYCDTDFRFTSDIIVRENEIQTVSTDHELFRKSTIVEKTVTRQPRFRFGIGAGAATHFNREWDIELNAAASIRRHTVSVGYGIRENRLCVGYRYDIISR